MKRRIATYCVGAVTALAVALTALGPARLVAGTEHAAEPVLSRAALVRAGDQHAARGDIGESILAFERAAWIAPRDEVVQAKLRDVRALAGKSGHEASKLERAASVISVNTLSRVAAAAFWCAALALVLLLTGRGGRALKAAAVLGATTAALASMAVAVRSPVLKQAVVLDPAPLVIAPFAQSASVGALGEGSKVEVQKRHGAFVRVRAADGAEGWVEGTRIESILI